MRRFIGLLAVAAIGLAFTPAQQQQQPQVRAVGKLDLSQPFDGPQLSPNGRFLAITFGDSVLVMEVASGRHWTVLRAYVEFIDWSPRGDLLAFSRGDNVASTEHIWALPIDPNTGRASGEAQRVSTSQGDVVSFSPDGQTIAFADYSTDPGQRLVLVPARGGRERVLAAPKVGIASIAWSSDGKWVYYSHTDRRHVERVPASGGAVEKVWESADGRFVEIIRNGPLMVTYELGASGREVAIWNQLDQQPLASFRANQGGNSLALTTANADATRFYASAFQSPQRLVSISLADGTARLLDRGQEPHQSSFSADGKRIAFLTRTANGHRIIAVENTDGTGRREYSTSRPFSGPKFSPDGAYVGFVAGGRGTQLILLDLKTGNERVLARAGVILPPARWRADGKALRYVGIQDRWKPSQRAIHEVTLAGVDRLLRVDTEGTGGFAPSINDSLAVFFSRDRVELLPLADGPARVVFTGPHAFPSFSPNLRFMAIPTVGRVAIRYQNPWAVSETDVIAIVDLRTGERRDLTLPFRSGGVWTGSPVWHSDGMNLLVIGNSPNERQASLYSVPVNGGRPRRIAPLGDVGQTHSLAITPDGKNALVSIPEPIRTDFLEFTLPGAGPSAPAPRKR